MTILEIGSGDKEPSKSHKLIEGIVIVGMRLAYTNFVSIKQSVEPESSRVGKDKT